MGVDADLELLLARAVELDEKAAGLDLEADPVLVAEVKAEAAAIRETLEALTEPESGLDDEAFGDPEDDPEPEPEPAPGVDGEVVDTPDPAVPPVDDGEGVKSWEPCSACGSDERDEFKTGNASCAECGHDLVEHKAFDFDDLDSAFDEHLDALLEGKADEAALEVKAEDSEELSEMELLLARRAALGT